MGKTRFIPVLMLAASLCLGAAAGQVAQVAQTSSAASPSGEQNSLHLMEAARALEISGQRDEALVDYTEAIQRHELSRDMQARALFSRGLLLDGMNRLGDAIQDYSAALALSPKFAAALNNRANIYRREGRFAEAEHDYRASLKAGNPQSQYPYYGLGQIAEARGKGAEAKAFYAKAFAAEPGFALATQRLAALEKPQAIHLRPPALRLAQGDANTGRAELPPAVVPTPPVHLHPPALKPAQKEDTTGPPILRKLAVASPPAQPVRLRGPAVPSPASHEEKGPALKPSLDQGTRAQAQIQLGAWRTEAEATQGWDRALSRAGDVLEGFSPRIVAVDLPGMGRYYRLRVATDKNGSKTLCAALMAKGLACFLARD